MSRSRTRRPGWCRQRTHNPLAAGPSKYKTTLTPAPQVFCPKAFLRSRNELEIWARFVLINCQMTQWRGVLWNKLYWWHTHRCVCFAGLEWNFSKNAVYVKHVRVCWSFLGVSVWLLNCVCVLKSFVQDWGVALARIHMCEKHSNGCDV